MINLNINFENVNYIKNGSYILENVNLKINKGDFVSIIGKNGCGKSTLIKHINGILFASSGEVFVNNINTKNEKDFHDLRKKIGIVFQNPDSQILASTVEEEIAFGLENLCVNPDKIKEKIENVLFEVGLEGFEKRLTYTLSGGQKQRLNIASILAMGPEIIILDEPTSMIDFYGKESIMNILYRLNKEKNMTIILVTHFMNEVVLSNKVVAMENGKIKSIYTLQELFSSKEVFERYLLPMQSIEILLFLRSLGYDVSINKYQSIDCAKEIIKLLESERKND